MTAVAQYPGIAEQGTDIRPTAVEALSLVMNEVRAVGKDQEFSAPGMGRYNFRGIDAVMNAAGPALRKFGVVPIPIVDKVEYRDVRTANQKPAREVTITVRYRFFGPRGDFLEAVVCGESMDSGDKGTAKAMSVAYRIALLQVLCLPTDDTDPDSQNYERGTGSVDVSAAAQAREQARPSREEMLQLIVQVLSQVQTLRQESDYAAYDRLARFCKTKLGVNIVTKQTEEGAIEDVDLNKLKDGQLWLLLDAMRKSLQQLTSTTQEV